MYITFIVYSYLYIFFKKQAEAKNDLQYWNEGSKFWWPLNLMCSMYIKLHAYKMTHVNVYSYFSFELW